jgi:hypothetical protein
MSRISVILPGTSGSIPVAGTSTPAVWTMVSIR